MIRLLWAVKFEQLMKQHPEDYKTVCAEFVGYCQTEEAIINDKMKKELWGK